MPNGGPRTRGTRVGLPGVLLAVLLGTVLVSLAGGGRAVADTPWGTTGAQYRTGIVCALPDGRRVALASWDVDGTTASSTDDVVAKGSSYGPAPRSGRATDATPGTRGLSGSDLAALAYLIGHGGAGTAAQVAETSALVAQSFGGGAAQRACLGRQGTSATGAAALATAARRYAGPYTVQASPAGAKPGALAPVSAVVRSAAGVPTPGITVTFAAAGLSTNVVTGVDGRASARLTGPSSPSAYTVTVAEPVGVRLIASRPAAVALAAPKQVVARAAFTPVLHPTPHLGVTGGGKALVLAGGSLTPTVTVSDTDGYSGTGSVSVLGPVAAPSGSTCSSVSYVGAPAAWSHSFTFAGDADPAVGATGPLKAGCYAFAGSLTVTDSSPVVTVKAAPDPASAVGVSPLQLTQSVGSGLARTGTLTATVTATQAAGATVTSTLTTYGPLPAGAGGRCDTGRTWTGAKVVARSGPVTLVQQGTDRLAAVVRTPSVSTVGCYALTTRSTVTQDGRSAVVTVAAGGQGTTVMVISPSLGVTNSAYDGRQGVPMTGTVDVAGTYGLAGRVTIGLVSAPAPSTGCHSLLFPAASTTSSAAPSGSTVVTTAGDGTYRFRSPVPKQNRCYGVTATLAMAQDAAVRVEAPAPGPTTTFLAGAVVRAPADIEVRTAAATRPTRSLAVFGATGAVVLAVALVLMIGAAVSGEHRPDPLAGELLVTIVDT